MDRRLEEDFQIFYARYWEIYYAIRQLGIECTQKELAHVIPMSDIYAIIFAFAPDLKGYDG